ncbi:MAG: Fe-S protein assembly co-chaperone HscB [Planctomycetaceae bacterium]|nr:Fe-S protein assembly co-chaperone HscB [Planctomycetaceae bacterium]
MDLFERLGLPRRFSVDAAELERAYLHLSRNVHPDYHLAGSDAALAESLDASAAVNEAYSVLRDPFTRADYLLSLLGGPTATEHKQMPGAFLAEMLEAREQIEEARGNSAAIAQLELVFLERSAGLMQQVGQLFTRFENTPEIDPNRANLLMQIRGLLNATKYVRGLLRDLHAD